MPKEMVNAVHTDDMLMFDRNSWLQIMFRWSYSCVQNADTPYTK